MKRFFAIILAILLLFSLTACGEDKAVEPQVDIPENYQKLGYEEFNKLAMEQGYSPKEDVDNSGVNFERCFTIGKENDFSLAFYELKKGAAAVSLFETIYQTFEMCDTNYSAFRRCGNYGVYVAYDDVSVLYIAYVENTVVYSLNTDLDSESIQTIHDSLFAFIDKIEYPSLEMPELTVSNAE